MRLFRGAGVVVVLSCMLTIFSGATTDEDDRTLTEKKSGNTTIVEGQYFRLENTNVPFPNFYNQNNLWYYDYDDDGDIDIVGTEVKELLEDKGFGYFAFENQGDGTFGKAPAKLLRKMVNHSNGSYFLAADFTGDGLTDLFQNAENYCKDGVFGAPNRLFEMTNKGRYKEVSATHMPQKKDFPHWLDNADVDADGDLDIFLACANLDGHTEWGGPGLMYYIDQAATKLLLNDGSGKFTDEKSALPEELVKKYVQHNQCTFIDVNKDGYPDLFINGPYDGFKESPFDDMRDKILMNDGTGKFYWADDSVLPQRYIGNNWGDQIAGSTYDTYGLTKADVNGDGWQDLIVTVWAYVGDQMPGTIQILINNKNGTFSNGFKIPELESGVDFVKPADINGDGWVDLICHAGQVYINQGKGKFKEYSKTMFPSHSMSTMNDNQPFDMDSDGDVDIIWRGLNVSDRTVFIWKNLAPFKPAKKKLKVPGKIRVKMPANGQAVTSGPTLEWNNKKRAINFRIQICEDQNFASFSSNDLDKEGYTGVTLDLSKLLYQPGFEGLKPGTTYYWRVAGWNYSGFGKWSGVRSFTTE